MLTATLHTDLFALIEDFQQSRGQRPGLRFLGLLQNLEPMAVQYVRTMMDMMQVSEKEAIAFVASELDELITWDWMAELSPVLRSVADRLEKRDGPRLEEWLTRAWTRAKQRSEI